MRDQRPTAHDPHVLGPDLAPTPFTADEIRRGCPVGRTIRVLVEADGEERSYRVNRYVAVDEKGATIERTLLAGDGSPIGPPETVVTTWLDLQRHASFPADRTEIGREPMTGRIVPEPGDRRQRVGRGRCNVPARRASNEEGMPAVGGPATRERRR